MARYNIKYSDFHILPVDPLTRCLQQSFRRASLAPGISTSFISHLRPQRTSSRGYVLVRVCALGDGTGSRACVLIAGEMETVGAETEAMHEDGQLSHTGK